MGTVARDRVRHHFGGKAGSLHRAQTFVVNRHRTRLVHGRGIALEHNTFDAIDAKQIGKRQPGRAGADYCDGIDVRTQGGESYR